MPRLCELPGSVVNDVPVARQGRPSLHRSAGRIPDVAYCKAPYGVLFGMKGSGAIGNGSLCVMQKHPMTFSVIGCSLLFVQLDCRLSLTRRDRPD